MKTIKLVSGLVMGFQLASFAQYAYDPYVSESKLWSELSGGYGTGMIECCHHTTFVQFSKGSSTAGDVEKVALVSTDSLKTWQPIGTIVEFNKKVYYRDLSSSQSRLLFDFGLAEGESVYLANYCSNVYRDSVAAKITKIDTVSYQGRLRKRFSVEYSNWATDYWIEGIGSQRGFLNTCIKMVGGFRELLCVKDNGTLIYKGENRGACYVTSVSAGIGKGVSKGLSVSFESSNRRIKIDSPAGLGGLSYLIHDLEGREVGYGDVSGKWIDVNLKNGVYFVGVIENDQLVFSRRFVISK